MLARLRFAVINVDLATGTFETHRTCAFEGIDHVMAVTAIEAWVGSAFINVNFTLGSSEAYNENFID